MLIRKTFKFEASHILPKHKGKCSRLHGHSWVLHVFVQGPIDPSTNFVMDYGEISEAVKPLIENLDHRHLGQWVTEDKKIPIGMDGELSVANWAVPDMPITFYPSSENILVWIGTQLWDKINWSKLALEETCTSYCELTRDEFNKDRTMRITLTPRAVKERR